MSAAWIVDSHVHFWSPAQFRYPWLDALPALNRAFLPVDYGAVSATAKVGKLLFVEGGCEAAQSLAEADWVSSMANTEPRIKGIVAQAQLEKGEAARVELESLARIPLVKGVRRNLQGEHDLAFCLQPSFGAGVRLLAEFGFTFDVCVRHEQLRSVAELARRVSEVNFVLDHFGKPDVRGKQREPWASELKALAKLPNVVCKFSGLTTEANWENWQPADLSFYFEQALECFGFDRLLFGSDWPVATLATRGDAWLETVQDFFGFTNDIERAKVFKANAERIYHV